MNGCSQRILIRGFPGTGSEAQPFGTVLRGQLHGAQSFSMQLVIPSGATAIPDRCSRAIPFQ